MPDIYIAAAAAVFFALWLRLQFYVLFGDGLAIAGVLFLLYLLIASIA